MAGLKADLTFDYIYGSFLENSTNSKLEELLSDLRVGENNETQFKRLLRHARAQNLTCNDPSIWTEVGQRLILSWEPDSTLTFHFRQGEDENVRNFVTYSYLYFYLEFDLKKRRVIGQYFRQLSFSLFRRD